MNALNPMAVLAAVLGDDALDVADVFSTDLYTGNGSTQSITNGLDMSGDGGLAWIKGRSGATDHQLFDTERGATKELISNSTAAEATDADTLTSFNSDGFSIGADSNVNTNAANYVGWSFRKAPKFFDVVTYTGNSTGGRNIPHNLGVTPGMIITKDITFGGTNWFTWHNSLSDPTANVRLDLTNAEVSPSNVFAAPTDENIVVGTGNFINSTGSNYVAYLFAHDTSDDGIIQCGSYTGNGSASGPTVTLGWEPQYLMVKNASDTWDWLVYDNVRGFSGSGGRELMPNKSNAEGGSIGLTTQITPSASGFSVNVTSNGLNFNGLTYIYMAIRAEGA